MTPVSDDVPEPTVDERWEDIDDVLAEAHGSGKDRAFARSALDSLRTDYASLLDRLQRLEGELDKAMTAYHGNNKHHLHWVTWRECDVPLCCEVNSNLSPEPEGSERRSDGDG